MPQDLQLTPMGLSLSSPLAVRSAFDGTGRLFIAERNGALLVHTPPSTLEVFLDLSADVDSFFEGGLLGVAFHPSFGQNGYLYVSYTRSGSGSSPLTSVIERYTVSSGDPDRADPLSGVDILTLAQPRGNHNGGDLHFGPDGFLYFGLGDGGGGDNVGNSQDLSTWHGKMLRIDPCDTPSCAVPYAIPSGNPYAATAGLDEIWSSGLRNPYRFSFDRQTGDLIIADV
ncbi:MAG: PQQ-dependent sugar dehydrogenase, partial [Acidobacteriota bacterium]